MALRVSTSPSEQLHFKHYLHRRYMGIKYGTQEMTQREALMEKFFFQTFIFFIIDLWF